MSGGTLGRYRLAAAAPAAGGAVLHAEDILLERPVDLLLVPSSTAAEPERLTRIRQEVERAAAFVHPSVAAVYGLEEAAGRFFVVLEPRTGRSLASLLAAGELSLENRLEAGLTLCDVLASAEEAGVVHGALHPGEVMVGDDGALTVGGFGLCELRRSFGEEIGESTPAFRAPEMAASPAPDPRADLFALGRILQELAAAGRSAAGDPLADMFSSRLSEIAERCLSADPARRPRSATELRQPLEALHLELLRPPEPQPEETPDKRRSGIAVRWRLLAAAALLAVLAGWALWRGAGPAQRTVAPAPAAEAAAVAEKALDLVVMPFAGPADGPGVFLAGGFGRELTRRLARGGRLSVVAADSAAAAAAGDAGARQIGHRLGVAHVLEGSFLWQRDAEMSRAEATVRLYRTSDGELLWSEMLEGFFGEIAEIEERIAAGVAARLAAADGGGAEGPLTTSPGAYEAYLEALGRAAVAGAAAEMRTAAAGLEQAVILDPGLLPAHTRQVRLQIALAASEEPAEALAAARRALRSARAIDPEDPEVRRAAGELELAAGGDPAAALVELRAALEELPGDPDLLREVALIDRRQGRWDEAVEGLSAALRRDPLDLQLAAVLVRTLTLKRRFDEAAEQVERLAERLPEAAEPGLLRADLLLRGRGERGRARAVLEGMPEAAREEPRWQELMLRLDLYDGDLEAALVRLPALRLAEGEELIQRAWIERYLGRDRDAAAAFEQARDLLDDRLQGAPEDPELSALLGQAYAGTGGTRLGVRMGQRAVAQLPVTVDAVAGAEIVELLARIYVLAGEPEAALDELAFLLEIPSPVTVDVLRLDPAWRPLRGAARFDELLERFGP